MPLVGWFIEFDIGFLSVYRDIGNKTICALDFFKRTYPDLESYKLTDIKKRYSYFEKQYFDSAALEDCAAILLAYSQAVQELCFRTPEEINKILNEIRSKEYVYSVKPWKDRHYIQLKNGGNGEWNIFMEYGNLYLQKNSEPDEKYKANFEKFKTDFGHLGLNSTYIRL